ncbi:pyruvate dehydrogenase complex dihydrolipoamide acetyltransferase component (E2) [Thoreauomyces humboldtii]|nr:pyruvate dehydrogenase complex dihydrolipoamide acetyltransferase component (E2) [Thoreauomyces humboldtii]
MPALSPTMTQGNLGTWNKKVGDEVTPGEVLVEVETDKATMDLENQDDGFLGRIFLESGTKDVPVGKPIAILVENKEDVEAFADYVPESSEGGAAAAPKEEKEEKPSKPEEEKPPAPKEKKLAPKKDSAPEKENPKSDVKKDAAPNKEEKPTKSSSKPAAKPAPASEASFVDHPVTDSQKEIASQLSLSKHEVPHYSLTQEISADKILKLREVLNRESGGKYKLSITDVVVRAAALALKAVPAVNSVWQGTSIRQFAHADIAVSVATEAGLVTPVVAQADTLRLSHISTAISTGARSATPSAPAPASTFTVAHIPSLSHFTGIVGAGNAATLSIGAVREDLVEDPKSEIGLRSVQVLTVTLTCDHRVVDGAVGAQWMLAFKGLLEDPLTMLL